ATREERHSVHKVALWPRGDDVVPRSADDCPRKRHKKSSGPASHTTEERCGLRTRSYGGSQEMVDGIVTAFVVLAIFAVVALLLGLYVWRVDPHQVAVWRAALRAKREGRAASTPHSASPAGPNSRKLRVRSFGGLRRGLVSGS